MNKTGFSVVLIFASLVFAADPPLQTLLLNLAGPDAKARTEARQLLPRQGMAAVEGVIYLLSHPDAAVAKEAADVLTDIVKQVTADADRKALTTRLMALVQADKPEPLRSTGLRLLAGLMPAGTEVSPIAAMLKEPSLREAARLTLQRLNTPEARAALRSALPGAEAAFQCALLNSLAEMKDAESVPAIKDLAAAGDPALRLAAVRALTWTGDAANIAVVQGVIDRADTAGKTDAVDTMLRLLEAVTAKGGDRQSVLKTYKGLLDATTGAQKQAVLAGMGRIGDVTCVGPILAVIRESEPVVQQAALAALREMKGADIAQALVEAYPALPEGLQPLMLPVLGSRKHPAALPLLLEAAESDKATMRLAAIKALGETELPEASDALTSAARTGTDEEKAAARQGLLRLGEALQKQQKPEEAGNLYSLVLTLAGDDASRTRALAGLAACPVKEAFDAAMVAAGNPALREPAAPALTAIGGKLLTGGAKDKARLAYEKVLQLNPPPDVLRRAARGAVECGAKIDLAPLLGIITSWWVIGPFELGEGNRGWNLDYIREATARPTGTYKSGYKELNWLHVISKDISGKIDLRATLANRDACIGYAYTEITVKQETDALLLLGVDDSEKVFVNGQKVFEQFVPRALVPDQDRVPVKLRAGRNTILLKIWQNMIAWEFCARLTTPDGRPLQFTQRME